MAINDALSTLSIGFVAAAGNYVGFSKIDSDLKLDARRVLYEFLDRKRYRINYTAIYDLVEILFTFVFGTRQWSLKCIRRSFILSSMIYLALFAMSTAENLLNNKSTSLGLIGSIVIGGLWIFISAIDFLAIWKSRFILRVSRGNNSVLYTLVLAICDIILSCFIFPIIVSILLIAVAIAAVVTDIFQGTPSYYMWNELKSAISGVFRQFIELYLPTLGLTTYNASSSRYAPLMLVLSSAITSFWIVFNVVLLFMAHGLVSIFPVAKFASNFINIEDYPVKVLGFYISSIIMTVSVLLAAIKL